MKVTLFASISANGKVLQAEEPTHQVPQEILNNFMQKALQAGNLVLGKNTANLMLQHNAVKQAFAGTDVVILSASNAEITGYKVVSTLQQVLKYLTDKGHSEIFIGGGTQTYNAFLKDGLVTNAYLNIIPVVTGIGGLLGLEKDLLTTFKLAEHNLMTKDVVQLHLVKE